MSQNIYVLFEHSENSIPRPAVVLELRDSKPLSASFMNAHNVADARVEFLIIPDYPVLAYVRENNIEAVLVACRERIKELLCGLASDFKLGEDDRSLIPGLMDCAQRFRWRRKFGTSG
jgi:hypothetical protein